MRLRTGIIKHTFYKVFKGSIYKFNKKRGILFQLLINTPENFNLQLNMMADAAPITPKKGPYRGYLVVSDIVYY